MRARTADWAWWQPLPGRDDKSRSGLAESYASRIPVLALVGQPPSGLSGLGTFQDSSGLAGSMDAYRLLPVVPTLASNAAEQAVRHRAAEVLRSAVGSVLIIAGEGVASADARKELNALAATLGAWVAVAPDAKDVYDNRDPRFVGVAGTMGSPTVADCARRAAACLVVGSRLPVTTRSASYRHWLTRPWPVKRRTALPAGERVVHVSGHLRGELDALACLLAGRPRDCPPHPGPRPLPIPSGRYRVDPQRHGRRHRALPQDAHVFVDAGNAGAAAIHLLPAPARSQFIVAVGMGVWATASASASVPLSPWPSAAEAQCQAGRAGLGGVVVDHVEDHLDARRVQRAETMALGAVAGAGRR
jgi:acetolactate synthase-1/2/3 large subunit